MLVVTTPTGQIGRQVLARLVAAGEPVRALARDRSRIELGSRAGSEVVEGSMDDPATLARALDGAEAVFLCVPPDSRAADVRQYYLGMTRPFAEALAGSTVRRVVFVSSGGRGRSKDAGVIGVAHEMEELLESTGVALRALRCGSFMENMLHQARSIEHQGVFSYPIAGDVRVPTCATRDIAATAARLLRDRSWSGRGGVGVHGPVDLSCDEMARIMTEVLGRPVRYRAMAGPEYEATLVRYGQSEAVARALVAMFREIARGLHEADPRTPESTTPTTFEAWCRDTLRPAIGRPPAPGG